MSTLSEQVDVLQYKKVIRLAQSQLRRLNYLVNSTAFRNGFHLMPIEKQNKFRASMATQNFGEALRVVHEEDDGDLHTWSIRRLRNKARQLRIPYYVNLLKHQLIQELNLRGFYREEALTPAVSQDNPDDESRACAACAECQRRSKDGSDNRGSFHNRDVQLYTGAEVREDSCGDLESGPITQLSGVQT